MVNNFTIHKIYDHSREPKDKAFERDQVSIWSRSQNRWVEYGGIRQCEFIDTDEDEVALRIVVARELETERCDT